MLPLNSCLDEDTWIVTRSLNQWNLRHWFHFCNRDAKILSQDIKRFRYPVDEEQSIYMILSTNGSLKDGENDTMATSQLSSSSNSYYVTQIAVTVMETPLNWLAYLVSPLAALSYATVYSPQTNAITHNTQDWWLEVADNEGTTQRCQIIVHMVLHLRNLITIEKKIPKTISKEILTQTII